MNIQTLQEKIEYRAELQARKEVEEYLNNMPYFEEFDVTYYRPKEVTVKLERWDLVQRIKEPMIRRRIAELTREISQQILDSVDQIAWLQEEVNNVKASS